MTHQGGSSRFLRTLAVLAGVLTLCGKCPAQESTPVDAVQSCKHLPKSCRDHVYIFLVNGLDPVNYGNLTGLRDHIQQDGFRQTYYGQVYHTSHFSKEVRKIHCQDPEAHFVFIGFSIGMNMVHSMAKSAAKEGIQVDLLLFLSGNNPVSPLPREKPDNVDRVVNVLAAGMMKGFGERDYAENVRLSDSWHFDSPMHPTTIELLDQELLRIASAVPVVTPVAPEKTMPLAFDPEPTPRPVRETVSKTRDNWDFLKPAQTLSSKSERQPATSISAKFPSSDKEEPPAAKK
jgi:hypothetical protein